MESARLERPPDIARLVDAAAAGASRDEAAWRVPAAVEAVGRTRLTRAASRRDQLALAMLVRALAQAPGGALVPRHETGRVLVRDLRVARPTPVAAEHTAVLHVGPARGA